MSGFATRCKFTRRRDRAAIFFVFSAVKTPILKLVFAAIGEVLIQGAAFRSQAVFRAILQAAHKTVGQDDVLSR